MNLKLMKIVKGNPKNKLVELSDKREGEVVVVYDREGISTTKLKDGTIY